MSYEFKRLGEVEALESVPEGANALIEVDGVIKRAPGAGLGGNGGGKTLIITDSHFDELMSTGSYNDRAPKTYSSNMTFDEFFDAFGKKEIIGMCLYFISGDPIDCLHLDVHFYEYGYDEPCFIFESYYEYGRTLYWTPSGGIS